MRARYLTLAKGSPALLRVAARCVAVSFALREASAPSWPAPQRAPAMPNRRIRSTWFTPFDSTMRDSLCRSSYMPILRPSSGGCPRLKGPLGRQQLAELDLALAYPARAGL